MEIHVNFPAWLEWHLSGILNLERAPLGRVGGVPQHQYRRNLAGEIAWFLGCASRPYWRFSSTPVPDNLRHLYHDNQYRL